MTKTERRGYKRLMEALRYRLGEEEFLRDVSENVSPETVVQVLGTEKLAGGIDPKELGVKQIVETVGTEETAKKLGREKLVEMLRVLEPGITASEIEKLIREGTAENEGDEKAQN